MLSPRSGLARLLTSWTLPPTTPVMIMELSWLDPSGKMLFSANCADTDLRQSCSTLWHFTHAIDTSVTSHMVVAETHVCSVQLWLMPVLTVSWEVWWHWPGDHCPAPLHCRVSQHQGSLWSAHIGWILWQAVLRLQATLRPSVRSQGLFQVTKLSS